MFDNYRTKEAADGAAEMEREMTRAEELADMLEHSANESEAEAYEHNVPKEKWPEEYVLVTVAHTREAARELRRIPELEELAESVRSYTEGGTSHRSSTCADSCLFHRMTNALNNVLQSEEK